MSPIQYTEVEGGALAVPNLPGRLGVPNLIRILGPITKAQHIIKGRSEANDECIVQDLENEDATAKFKWSVPTIAKMRLEEKFPKQAYIGKTFKVTRWGKGEGGKASPVELVEIKVSK